MKYQTCPHCGCNLDFGETCDCRKQEKEGSRSYEAKGGEAYGGSTPAALRQQAEHYLGEPIETSEWDKAKEYAERKLDGIIEREGDGDGARRETWYLAQFIAETVKADRLSAFLFEVNKLLEFGTKKDSSCPKTQSRPSTYPYFTTAVSKMQ